MDTYATNTIRIGSYDSEPYATAWPPRPMGMQAIVPPMIFWAGLVLCFAMGGLVALSGNKTAAAAVPGVFCVLSMFVAPQISLYVFMAWQAWDGILIQEEGAILTPAKVLAFVVILVCLIHYGRGKATSHPAVVVLAITCIYVLYSLATAPAAIAKLAAFRYAAQILILVFLVFIGLRVIDNLQRVRAILVWLILGTLFASLVLLRYGESAQYGRATLGEYVNPNTTAMAIGLAFAAIPALWALATAKWKWAIKVLCIVSALVFAAGMIKTGSRSALIGALMAVGIGVLVTSRQDMAKKMIFLLLISMVFAGTMFFALRSGMLSDKTQLRFESMLGMTDEGVIQDSRFDVWKESLGAWLRQQPLLGVGLGNTAMARQTQFGTFQDVHSSLIGPFVEGGLIGGLLFWSLLAYLFVQVWARRRSALGMPLFVMYFYLLLSCVAHTIHFTKWFWIPVFLIVMLMEWVPEDREARVQDTAMAEYERARVALAEGMASEETKG